MDALSFYFMTVASTTHANTKQIFQSNTSTGLVGTIGTLSATESSIFASNTIQMLTANYTYTLPTESGSPAADSYFANTVLVINGE